MGPRFRKLLEMSAHDLKFALRTLLRSPGFSTAAVLTLALGIGANTAMFTLVDAVMLRPLPYADPDRIVMLWTTDTSPPDPNAPKYDRTRLLADTEQMQRWAERNRSFEGIGGYRYWRFSLTGGGGETERVQAAVVAGELFRLLHVSAALGRTFTQEELRNGDRVTVVSHALWVRRFGGDSKALGRTLDLDGQPHTIIGILPQSFTPLLPNLTRAIEVWTPPSMDFTARRRNASVFAAARLKAGVSWQQAQAEMESITKQMQGEQRRWNRRGINVQPARKEVMSDVRGPMLVLFGALGCVLLIACVNVANLMLARTAARRKEIGVRAVLGAGRLRIARQLLLESLLVSVVGGALGLAVSSLMLKGILALSPIGFGKIFEIRMDAAVVLFTSGAALLTGMLFGLLPAFQAARTDLGRAIKESAAGAARRPWLAPRNLLVIAEVTLAFVLLAGAGLLLRSFALLRAVDPGFRTEDILTVTLPLTQPRFREGPRMLAFADDVLQRLERVPAIRHAGFTNSLPLGLSYSFSSDFRIVGKPALAGEPYLFLRTITPGYFAAIGHPLRSGRYLAGADFTRRDAVLINEAAARQFWAGENPIGQQIEVVGCKPCTIVGVVADIKHNGLDSKTLTELYLPLTAQPQPWLELVLRTRGDPGQVIAAVRSAVRAADPAVGIDRVRTMQQIIEEQTSEPRFHAVLLGIFAGLATLLAAIGIFGVISYSVAQRTRDIGIRMALGAERSAVLAMVVRQALALALGGLALGIVFAFAGTRLLRTMLFGVGPNDPMTFSAVGLLVLAIALAAAWVPAHRATRIDPIRALRWE